MNIEKIQRLILDLEKASKWSGLEPAAAELMELAKNEIEALKLEAISTKSKIFAAIEDGKKFNWNDIRESMDDFEGATDHVFNYYEDRIRLGEEITVVVFRVEKIIKLRGVMEEYAP